MKKQKVRTIWLSDTHLGNKNTQAERLSAFLDETESDYLYLLGDIIDLWKMSKKGHWPSSHQKVLDQIFAKAKAGTKVIYVPGNHDPFFKDFSGLWIAHVEVHKEYCHTSVSGKKLMLIHGDQFDAQMPCSKWLYAFADIMYECIVSANRKLNQFRRALGLGYWSLSGALKLKSKKVRHYIAEFERQCVAYAKEKGVDGIVAGHIHQAKLSKIDGIIYANDGDWIESCTSLVETVDGKLMLLDWAQEAHQVMPDWVLATNK